MRLLTLGDDCYTLLHVVPQQYLEKIPTLLPKEQTHAHTRTHMLTCAALRRCFLATSATTGSSSSLWGSVSPLNLRQDRHLNGRHQTSWGNLKHNKVFLRSGAVDSSFSAEQEADVGWFEENICEEEDEKCLQQLRSSSTSEDRHSTVWGSFRGRDLGWI